MWTYEDIEPIIPNTIMQKAYMNGVHRVFRIQAAEGYVLHDKNYDLPVYDENWNETGEITLGYHTGVVSCAAAYDFAPAEMQDEAGNVVTAYGNRQFYTKLASDVPTDQIFGNDEPKPEVM
jgi:hypothetical protein